MFSRIRVWWASRGRALFRYYDGARWRRADPLAVVAALERELPKYRELLTVAGTDPMKAPMGAIRDEALAARKGAVTDLAAGARRVFALPPLTDTAGLTDVECAGVLTAFFLYMEELATAAQVFPTSRQPA